MRLKNETIVILTMTEKKTRLIKLAAVALSIILLIVLAGCGKTAETPERGSSTSVSWSDKAYQSAEEMMSKSEATIISEVSSLSAESLTPATRPAYTAVSGDVSVNSEISYALNEQGQTYGNMNPELSPEIQEAPQLIAAIGIDGTSGYVYYDDLQGELPNNPEEALSYMEKLNEQIAEARKRGDQYLRYIPLYESDGKTVIGSFGISIPTQMIIN